MSTPDVRKQITLPAGALPRDVDCYLKLVAAVDQEAFGYVSSLSLDIAGETHRKPDNTGLVTFPDVVPNSLVTPSGTVYRLTVRFPGGTQTEEYLEVTDVAGPLDVADILTTAPSNLPPAGATNATLGGAMTGTVGAAAHVPLAVRTAALAKAESAQDAVRRASTVGRARITEALQVDGIIGDSIGAGSGATPYVDDWATRLAAAECRAAGLPDPGPGLIMPTGTRDGGNSGLYGDWDWDTLVDGTAVEGIGGTGSARLLDAAGDTVGHVVTARRVLVIIRKQTSGATFRVSTDNGATWGTTTASAGSGYVYHLTPDLGTVASRTVLVDQVSTGADGVLIEGLVPYLTAGTSGVVPHCMAYGGSTTADWLSWRHWENHLTALVTAGTPMRRLFISLGGNDAFNGVAVATATANLATIIGRAQAASPLTEVVLVGAYHPSKPTAGKTLVEATWRDTWLPALEQVAADEGATWVDLYARIGSVAEDIDPYDLTMDNGLHLDGSNQGIISEVILERLGRPTRAVAGLSADGSVPITGPLTSSADITVTGPTSGYQVKIDAEDGAVRILDEDGNVLGGLAVLNLGGDTDYGTIGVGDALLTQLATGTMRLIGPGGAAVRLLSLANGVDASDAANVGQITTAIAGLSTVYKPVASGLVLLDKSTTAVTVTGTVTETNLLSYSLAGAAVGDVYRLKAWGTVVNSSGVAYNGNLISYLGASVLGNGGTNHTSSANTKHWVYEVEITVGTASLSVQTSTIEQRMSAAGAGSTSLLTMTPQGITRATTEALASAKTLRLTSTHANATASMTTIRAGYTIHRIR